MQVFLWLLVLLLGYALGNFNGALLVSKLLMHDDVRTHGSGNAGLTNFFRTYGGLQTLLVIAIDVVKTVAACLLAQWLLGPYGVGTQAKMLAGLAVMLGHSYPAASQFRGGKGILCGASLAAVMDWRIFLLILAVFVLTVALTRYVSLGSILAAAGFGVCFPVVFWRNWTVCAAAVLAACFVVVRHRANIKRLLSHTESKLSFHKK